MRKILLLAALLLTVAQLWAADVDALTAQNTAQRFLLGQAGSGQFKAVAANLKLAHVQRSAKAGGAPVYYIFNSDNAFVIVSGEDRAREILAYGEGNIQDVEKLPENMKYWLTYYQRQMEFLQANPGIKVDVPELKALNRAAQSVNPMITAKWSQNSPYWNECPAFGADTCYTGCPATSLAMVFHYWKYPQQLTPEVPSYMMPSYAYTLPALPPTTFDWANMLNEYKGVNYTEAQATAVAHLMRYIGQVEEMDYTISGSGAYMDDILRAVLFFEYDQNARMLYKDDELGYPSYSDSEWAALILNELTHGRPIVYCAYDNYTGEGHAFNVDGYDAASDTYSINWGWNGRGNGYYALNAFGYDQYTFGTGQQMIVGIQPPEGYHNPRLQAYPLNIDLESYINRTATATVSLKGTNLTSGVTLTLNDAAGVFSIDATSLTADEANEGRDITVTFAPTIVGNYTATLTCSNGEADPVTVTIHAVAPLEVYTPVMQPVNESKVNLTSFRADWSDMTPAGNVDSYTLEVSAKPAYTLLEEVDFSDLPQMAPANQASHATDYLPDGWSFSGSEFNLDGGCVSLRRNSSITTDELSLRGYDKMTIEVTARAYGYYGDGSELYITTSAGTQEVVFMYAYETKTIVVPCAETEQVTFKAGYYPMIRNIKIYAGDVTQAASLTPTETGGDSYRLIEGITPGKSYTVNNLTPGGTFLYKVKALYIDGTESEWSNVEIVTLFENTNFHDYEMGDVNHDQIVDIEDVTALIAYILGNADGICTDCANVNGIGAIDIEDVTALISKVLGN